MKILVGWDNPDEAALITLYLNVDENTTTVCETGGELLAQAQAVGDWDVILLATRLPDLETAYAVFTELRMQLPETPVVGACVSEDVFRIARFMTHGLRTYLIRDANNDFMFLLQASLHGTVEAVRAEREKIISAKLRQEIESVRKLQESIIPRNIISPEGYQVVARYEASQIQVFGGQPVTLAGGDYYDVFTMPDNSLVILLGDASGHGMKACMSIMTMHTLVSMIRTRKYKDTAAFVHDVNNRLCEQRIVSDEGGFITLLYGVLDPVTHEFQWTSAGHPLPVLHNLETNETRRVGGNQDGGLPLGIYPGMDYDFHSLIIPPQSRLLVYTDGLEEAFPGESRGHQEYGLPGILGTLASHRATPLPGTLQALFDDSNAFTQGSGRHDDTSVVLLERL